MPDVVISPRALMRRARPTNWIPLQRQANTFATDEDDAGTSTPELLQRAFNRAQPAPLERMPPASALPATTGERLQRSLEVQDTASRPQYSSLQREMPLEHEEGHDASPLGVEAKWATGTPTLRLQREIANRAEELATAPQQQPVAYPHYQPLERNQTTGFKNRVLGAIEGLAAGYARTGNWAGAAGGAVGGAVNRNAARQQLWQQTALPQELKRITWDQLQRKQARQEAIENFANLLKAATALKALQPPAEKNSNTGWRYQNDTGTYYRTGPDGKLEFQQAPPTTTRTPKPRTYTRQDAVAEQEAEDGPPEKIVEDGLRARIPSIEAALPAGTLDIIQRGVKKRPSRDLTTGKPTTVEVPATKAEVAAAVKLREQAIDRERKRMLDETKAVARQKTAQRYLKNRTGNTGNAPAAAAKPEADELNRYEAWLRSKGVSEAEIQSRLNAYR